MAKRIKRVTGASLRNFSYLSKTTILIALCIIISASFMLQLMRFLQGHIGRDGLIILVGLMLVVPGLAFLIYTIIDGIKGKTFDPGKVFVQAVVLSMIVVLAWQIENYAERIHVAEFVLLGWFAGRDMIKTGKGARGVILACAFCAGVGLLDEIFQAILPHRFFDLNDIISNTLGGGWGTVLYIITKERKGQEGLR